MVDAEVNSIIIKRQNKVLNTDAVVDEDIDKRIDIRPSFFAEYPGQDHVKENLSVYVKAALKRNKPMDHVILHGPPGLGKTTLAHILANELKVSFYPTSAPSFDKVGDLAGILANIKAGSLLFIDEIHRLSTQVEEALYSAMEDFKIDIIVGEGPTARTVSLPINPFTLVGATTKLSSLSRPFISRFGIQERLEYYTEFSLGEIIKRTASLLSIKIDCKAVSALARRSRGTPRIANRLLSRVADFAIIEDSKFINDSIVNHALDRLKIDRWGLDRTDRNILEVIKEQYKGGPVGIEAIAVTVGEERATIEEIYEPYLIHAGFLKRGPRGRCLSEKSLKILE